ncbi:MAG TPA: MarR family transcriptional regulator [Candidatus Ligilactobacillus excrementigallinarum]|uniref:MarR family transcriptional regulator n=1 Tax=Candidatus Ligilactobacillus excrementigallinarum TaxID=2838641 RepID=A0A9D1UWH5_9LACO|nr:MarR family transcriptional regulator [Candidatus Ligilactobacillus excrementigallinarum]
MLEHKPYHLEDELCFAIYSAQKSYNHFYSEALKKFNLTYPQYITLLVMWEERRPMMVKDIGKRLNLDTGTLTPLLKRLEMSGWVTRTRSGLDGRRVYLELTEKAKNKEKDVKNAVSYSFRLIDMNSKEYETSVKLLQEITRKLNELNASIDEIRERNRF